MTLRQIRLSATADSDFQACQRRYQLGHICGLESTKDKDAFRVGTVWHKCHELLEMKSWAVCPKCQKREEIRPDCYLCGGTGIVPEDTMESVVRYLNYKYEHVPENKTREDWETERVSLLYSLSGHRWFYSSDNRFAVVGSEIKYEIPVINPITGRKMPRAVFVGKVDKLVRDKATGFVFAWERKSTSKDLGDDKYWTGLTRGDQVSGYIYGCRYAQASGQLAKWGIMPDDEPVAGAFVDVWHKPDIKPKVLSQGDTAEFLSTGIYYGTRFDVAAAEGAPVVVNGTLAEVVPGKRANAIRETADMYGARLLADIAERPTHYFAQRPISMTDAELIQLQRRLFNITRQIRHIEKNNMWVCNRSVCTQPFYCEFFDLCNSIGFEAIPGPEGPSIPSGYDFKFRKEEVM